MSAMSILEFAAKLAAVESLARHAAGEAVKDACKIVETEAKRVIGTYDHGWPQLAQSTQEERARLGFHPNEPLLRTGELRESIETTAPVDEGRAVCGYVGSKDPVAKFQELGTRNIPPRPFLTGACVAKEKEIREVVGGHFFSSVFRK